MGQFRSPSSLFPDTAEALLHVAAFASRFSYTPHLYKLLPRFCEHAPAFPSPPRQRPFSTAPSGFGICHKWACCSAKIGPCRSLEAPGEASKAQGRGDVQHRKDCHQAAKHWPVLQHASQAVHHLPSKRPRLSACSKGWQHAAACKRCRAQQSLACKFCAALDGRTWLVEPQCC